MIETIKKLKELLNYVDDRTLFLKNATKVGQTKDGKDVLCTYIRLSQDSLDEVEAVSLEVLFDFKDCDLFGVSSDFAPVIYYERNNGTPRFLPERWENPYKEQHETITMFPNALQIVLEELESTGKEWLDHLIVLDTKSLDYQRRNLRNFDSRRNGTPFVEFTWEEDLEWLSIKGELNHLMYRHPINSDFERRDKMLAKGEKAFKEEEETASRMMKESGAADRIKEAIQKRLDENKKNNK